MKANIGIYNLHMQAMGGGEKLSLVLAECLRAGHNVSLFCAEPLDIASVEQFFGVDLNRVKVYQLSTPGPPARMIARLRGTSASASSLHHYNELRRHNLDLLINNSYASGLRCPASRGIYMCMFPHVMPSVTKDVLDSYSTVVAISQYSAEWVGRRWHRDAEIIHPPCDDMGPPARKEKVILHVGRFLVDSDEDERHHKGQRLLLETFKQMHDLHRDGWELHFTGSVGRDTRFADSVVQAARGFPVFFHFNSPRAELRELYRKSAIYWHATGYGFDAPEHPGKQEHFGITTVEAMSAAAVPVVYPTGGQAEIVTDKVNGLWWYNSDQLIENTRRLATDADLRGCLSDQAVCSSKRFGREVFASRIDRLVTGLLSKGA